MVRCSLLFSGLFSIFLIHCRIWAVPINETESLAAVEGFKMVKALPEADISQLIHVHVIFRHGDRNPSILMPTDFGNPGSSWVEGRSELTPQGVAAEFKLGQLIRRRYSTFLPKWYSGSALRVRSSDYNRTLMSAQAVMAGIFPAEATGIPRPIPIHTIDVEKDKVNDFERKSNIQIINDGIQCLGADDEDEKVFKKMEYLEEENADLFEILNKESGFQRLGLSSLWKVYDSLWAEKLHNRQWPSWMNEELFARIQHLNNLAALAQFNTTVQLQLRAGPLMTEIVRRMRHKLWDDEDERSQKLVAYSGHDATVAGALSAIGFRLDQFPQFSTAVFFELHRGEAGSPVVRIFYKNATDSDDLYELRSKKCPFGCRFSFFQNTGIDVSAGEWEKLCGGQKFSVFAESGTLREVNYSFWILVLTGVLVVLALIILTVQFIHLWRSKYRVLKL